MNGVSPRASDKSAVRLKFRNARARFAERAGHNVGPRIQSHAERLLHDLMEPGLQVALYNSRAEEAPLALTPREQYFYPRVEGEHLRFYRPLGPLVKSSMGIDEPEVSSSVPMDLSKPMLIFCPAVAVDSYGVRIGMGKGYYDRFLADHSHAKSVAVVFQIQVSSEPLHADSWDQPVDWIVTEDMVLRTLN